MSDLAVRHLAVVPHRRELPPDWEPSQAHVHYLSQPGMEAVAARVDQALERIRDGHEPSMTAQEFWYWVEMDIAEFGNAEAERLERERGRQVTVLADGVPRLPTVQRTDWSDLTAEEVQAALATVPRRITTNELCELLMARRGAGNSTSEKWRMQLTPIARRLAGECGPGLCELGIHAAMVPGFSRYWWPCGADGGPDHMPG